MVFSDEHKFKQFKGGNPAHDQVWAKSVTEVPGKEVEQWGLTVHVWTGISSRGKTKLFIYEGGLDAKGYQHILEQALVPLAKAWFKEEKGGWELQQDKATAYTAKSTTLFLEQKGIAVVEGWPPRATISTPWRTCGLFSTRGWRQKSSIPKIYGKSRACGLGRC